MNQGLPPYGKLYFTEDGVEFDGDIEPLVGSAFEIRPIKVQNRTVLAEIGNIQDADGETLTTDEILFGNPSISDLVVTLQNMNPAKQETMVNALSKSDPRKYDSLVSFVSSKVPGKVDFTAIK